MASLITSTAQSMLQSDPISGRAGSATVIIGNSVEELFDARNISATTELLTEDVVRMGVLGTGTKNYGWKGTGTMELYYVSSRFRDLFLTFYATGVMPPFQLTIENSDNASTAGTNTVTLMGCVLTGSLDLGKIDGASGILTETVNFSFTDVIYTNQFTNPLIENIKDAIGL